MLSLLEMKFSQKLFQVSSVGFSGLIFLSNNFSIKLSSLKIIFLTSFNGKFNQKFNKEQHRKVFFSRQGRSSFVKRAKFFISLRRWRKEKFAEANKMRKTFFLLSLKTTFWKKNFEAKEIRNGKCSSQTFKSFLRRKKSFDGIGNAERFIRCLSRHRSWQTSASAIFK